MPAWNNKERLMDIQKLLTYSVNQKASDLHLSTGVTPMIRLDGDLQRIKLPGVDSASAWELIEPILTEMQKTHFKRLGEIDLSYEIPNVGRFRVNVFSQARGPSAAFRTIPAVVISLDELGMPPIFKTIAEKPRGLVLMTGPTGSGKSTTLAAMIDYINSIYPYHIVTIEDPIEFIHKSKVSLVNQREVYNNTKSFNAALRAVLRQDPDIILVGELRDMETIRLALTAAETGHLVFGTLHTNSAAKTVNRIIDVFPGDEKAMVRAMLSNSLEAVIAQALVKKIGGGRIAALEIMLCNNAIRNLIREDKVPQIYSAIQTNTNAGMMTLEQHLRELLNKKIINRDSVLETTSYPDMFL